MLPSPIPSTTDLDHKVFLRENRLTFRPWSSPCPLGPPEGKACICQHIQVWVPTCTRKLAMIFPSFRLKARMVFRPLKIGSKREGDKFIRPVVVKNKLICLVEDSKDVKNTFGNLQYWLKHIHQLRWTLGMSVLQTLPVLRSSISMPPVQGA